MWEKGEGSDLLLFLLYVYSMYKNDGVGEEEREEAPSWVSSKHGILRTTRSSYLETIIRKAS